MDKYQQLKNRHESMLQLAGEISSMLCENDCLHRYYPIRNKLATLSGKLIIMFAVEDSTLFPALLRCSDPRARLIANYLISERETIMAELDSYTKSWPVPHDLSCTSGQFAAETGHILSRVVERIRMEENEMHKLTIFHQKLI